MTSEHNAETTLDPVAEKDIVEKWKNPKKTCHLVNSTEQILLFWL